MIFSSSHARPRICNPWGKPSPRYPLGTESPGHCKELPTNVNPLPSAVGPLLGAGLGSATSCVLRSPLIAGSCAHVGKITTSIFPASIASVSAGSEYGDDASTEFLVAVTSD